MFEFFVTHSTFNEHRDYIHFVVNLNWKLSQIEIDRDGEWGMGNREWGRIKKKMKNDKWEYASN